MDERRWLTFDLFEGRVGEVFEVGPAGADGVPLTLVRATESAAAGGAGPAGQPRLQFSLEFAGDVDLVLPQATYLVHHEQLGELELFLVPLGPESGAMRYEAAFA